MTSDNFSPSPRSPSAESATHAIHASGVRKGAAVAKISAPADSSSGRKDGERAEAPEHVRQNIEAIVALEQRADHAMTRHQRFIERLTAFVGRPRFLYFVVALGAAWMLVNLALPRRLALDPPPFSFLQLLFTSAGLFVAIMVLITQNRQARIADQRGHLDLQVNLLAEQKVTKLIEMLDSIQRDEPRSSTLDPMTEALKSSVDPNAVVDALEIMGEEPHEE